MHNNFEEGPYKSTERISLYSRLSDSYRVLTPLRRGYGRSTKTDLGFDVATQAEDLLKFMDFLGIEKAVLWARIPATQDLIWIAEHHPERVLGLIFAGNPLLFCMTSDEETKNFINNNWLTSSDLQEMAVKIVNPRAGYRPHCLEDNTSRIKIPTLRFWTPGDLIGIELGSLNRIERVAKRGIEGNEGLTNYFIELAEDKVRIEHLQNILTECDRSDEMDDAMVRAFGAYMKTVDDSMEDSSTVEDHLQFREKHIREFLLEHFKD